MADEGLSPLGEAEVVEVRRVERLAVDVVLHERLDEDVKEDPAELEVVGAERRFVAEDDVEHVMEGRAEALPLSSFVGIMSEMALTMNGER